MEPTFNTSDLKGTLQAAIMVARRYRQLTGKPLGITGEVGELMAAELLGLTLSGPRQAGYDAVGSDGRRIQIKTRCLIDLRKPGQRIGSIKTTHDWDSVILFLVNVDYEPMEAFEALRGPVIDALKRPGSKARNERGALSVSMFKSLGRRIWPPESPTRTAPLT